MSRTVRSLILFAVLVATWLLMSGHYNGLLTTLGIISCALATWLAHRIGATDGEGLPLHMMARLPGYILWLLKEIVMSNIATGKLISGRRSRLSSRRRRPSPPPVAWLPMRIQSR